MRIDFLLFSQTSEEVNTEPQRQGVQSHKASAVCGEMGWADVDWFPRGRLGSGVIEPGGGTLKVGLLCG